MNDNIMDDKINENGEDYETPENVDSVVGVGDPKEDYPEIGGHVEENPNFTKSEERLD